MSPSTIKIVPIRDTKFTTKTVSISLCDTLSEERASYNALLPMVLRRGSVHYPSTMEMNIRCQELYDTGLFADVDKKGETQIMNFTMSVVEDRYVKGETDLFAKAVKLLFEMLTDPYTENGVFKTEYVEQEKENLCDMIESKVNDKSFYANHRCLEIMCEKEAYSVDEAGDVKRVRAITPEDLYRYYREVFLKKLAIVVYVTGNVTQADLDVVADCCRQLEQEGDFPEALPTSGVLLPVQGAVKEVTEPMRVIQGKLCLGFRTQTGANDPLYPALTICNMILGGGMESKLFQNVREKASLAYYAYSRVDKFKGLMIIAAGINVSDKERAQQLILAQVEELKKGNITEKEFVAAKNTYLDTLCQMSDKQRTQADYYLGQAICRAPEDLEILAEGIQKVTKETVIEAAQRIALDTIYFLTATEE